MALLIVSLRLPGSSSCLLTRSSDRITPLRLSRLPSATGKRDRPLACIFEINSFSEALRSSHSISLLGVIMELARLSLSRNILETISYSTDSKTPFLAPCFIMSITSSSLTSGFSIFLMPMILRTIFVEPLIRWTIGELILQMMSIIPAILSAICSG